MNHEELCDRAAIWLRTKGRCDPVFTRGASCREIPDAIGWGSNGSTVIECKTSIADFLADAAKYKGWKHPEYKWTLAGIKEFRRPRAAMIAAGYEEIALPSMGQRRFFMCEFDLITADMVKSRYPDHGLIQVRGRSFTTAVSAPPRTNVAFASEIRYLRMRLIHLRDHLLRTGCAVDLDGASLFIPERESLKFPIPGRAQAI